MIDTHCHIDEEAFREDWEEVLQRQQQAGVTAMVVPGIDVHSIASIERIRTAYPEYIWPAIGLHPEEVKEDWEEQLATIREALVHPSFERGYCAIGEIGLDYHWDITYKEQQKEVLRRQLQWARELNLPVILHNRDSLEDILRIVREEMPFRGVFHCFNGSRETVRQILDMGLYIGIGGVLTFKNCHLAEHLDVVPMDRIVLETDAPYMAPVPHRGERNESRWILHVAERLSEVYGVSTEEVIEATTANAKTLFGIR